MHGLERKLDQLFKVLSDNTRLRLLSLLAQRPHCVCEFQSILRASQPTVTVILLISGEAGWWKWRDMADDHVFAGQADDPFRPSCSLCVRLYQ